jgi:hypothetical protein
MQPFLLHLMMRFRNKILLSMSSFIIGWIFAGIAWGIRIEPLINNILFCLGMFMVIAGAIALLILVFRGK